MEIRHSILKRFEECSKEAIEQNILRTEFAILNNEHLRIIKRKKQVSKRLEKLSGIVDKQQDKIANKLDKEIPEWRRILTEGE